MPRGTEGLVLEQVFWVGTVVTGAQITKHSGTKDLARSVLALTVPDPRGGARPLSPALAARLSLLSCPSSPPPRCTLKSQTSLCKANGAVWARTSSVPDSVSFHEIKELDVSLTFFVP